MQAQESTEQCHQRLDAQRLHDCMRRQMDTPEQAEHRRAAYREAQGRYRKRLIARETTAASRV